MIFLDANAFYWYLGRENLFAKPSTPKHDVIKLNNFFDTHSDKSIPASAFMEMIVHFRDDPDKIMKIVKFRETKGIVVFNNFADYCFTPDELTVLHVTTNKSVLTNYAYKLLDKKIDIEVKHAYAFLQIVSLLYADYYLKTCSSLDNEKRDAIMSYLGRDLSDEMRNDVCSQLATSLKDGYADNNRSQQALKEKYIELLVQNCVVFQMVIDTAVKFLENEDNLYDVMCKSASDAKNKGFTDSEVMSTIKAALSIDSAFLQTAENEISSIFEKKGYSKHQADYLKSMLKAWLERGQKLIKNDIFDMLCVGSLDKIVLKPVQNALVDQSSYLISFDKTMMNFLCNNSGNVRLLNQFLLPEHQLTI